MADVSARCAANLHFYCQETSSTCSCPQCHFGPCAQCGDTNLATIYDGLCASCERKRVRNNPKRTQACDACGQSGAFRNPATRRNEYFCASCHAKTGEGVRLRPREADELLSSCAGRDINDPAHRWVHVRGTRFQCQCRAVKFDPELRKRMRER